MKKSFKSNCLVWVVRQRLYHGGRINWHKSDTWWGFHNSWTDQDGVTWEFTVPLPRRQPWWYIPFWYRGRVRKRI